MIPFLRNNDRLHHLNFKYFDVGLQCARNIALLLSQESSLKRLSFDEEIGLDDEVLSHIATALKSQPQMEELLLSSNSVGRNGYVALGNALEGCLSLRKLDLAAFNFNGDNDDRGLIDDEGIRALVEGLKHCHNLTSLLLYGNLMIAEEASRSLSTLFQSDNCRLERLDLAQMNIDDDEIAVLSTGLVCLPSLKRLDLRNNSIGDEGLQALVGGLVNCNLEELTLSHNMFMESVSGLRALGKLVGRATNMRVLDLTYSSITDEGLQSFVEGTENCCSLTRLDLSYNRSITANGLASLSSLLRAEHCTLSNLHLYGINVGDNEAVVLANGLTGNKSLRELNFGNSSITVRGWAAFSKLLCDKSSVSDTYLSNHTLVYIGGYILQDLQDTTTQDIEEYLKFNKFRNQAAAICKILHSHPDIDVTPLFQFDLKCLPLVVKWLKKAKLHESTEVFKNRKLSAVYKFVRGMPLLAVNGHRSQKVKDVQLQLEVKSKKRKLDQSQ